jgi:hypothetical protein
MAIIRCPHCRLPLIEEEARTGVCPVCAAPLRGEAPPPAPAEIPGPPSSEPPRAVRTLPWALLGKVALCLLCAAIEFYLLLPPRPSEPQPEKAAVPAGRKPKRQQPDRGETAKQGPEQATIPPDEPDPVPPPAVEPKPAGKRRALASLPLLKTNAITIDGDLSDWKEVPPLPLKVVQKNESSKKAVLVPKTQLAYLAYCPKGLLLAVDVEDTSGALENDGPPGTGTWAFWDNDAVEIYIDTRNSHSPQRGAASMHQFFAFPFGTPNDPSRGGYESRILKDDFGRVDWTIVPQPARGVQAMRRAGKKTAGGWALETLIPKAALRQAEIRPGNRFGFELQIDTGTNVYYYWASDDPFLQASLHPNLWGEVLFAGADAAVEVLDAAGRPSPSFVPGTPLTVRVTDPDVDLDPEHAGPLVVTLRSRGGDLKKLALQETGPESGVFVGTIATRLGNGPREDGIFDVSDGDEVSVEYVDRWRSNGDRDVTVRAGVKALPLTPDPSPPQRGRGEQMPAARR